MPRDIEAIAEQVFAALADPTRRAILATLASEGPATATDLAGRLPITRQAIAKHLALLAEAGLGTRLTVVETGFAQLPDGVYGKAYDGHIEGWGSELGELASYLDAA